MSKFLKYYLSFKQYFYRMFTCRVVQWLGAARQSPARTGMWHLSRGKTENENCIKNVVNSLESDEI